MRAFFPRFVRCALLASVLVCVAAQAAHAQAEPDTDVDSTRATARQLGAQGLRAYWANDFATAEEKLDRAYRLFAAPTLGLWSARARVQLGRLAEAAERYREAAGASDALGDSALQKEAQREATAELIALLPRIPTLTIQIEDAPAAEVNISVDGVALPTTLVGTSRLTDPGTHHLAAVSGNERYMLDVNLVEKQHETRVFKFHLTPEPAPVVGQVASESAPPVAPYRAPVAPPSAVDRSATTSGPGPFVPVAAVALGLGAAGLITAAITAGLAMSRCPEGQCASADDLKSYRTLETTATVSFYAGLALSAGGLITWLLAPSAEHVAEPLALEIGPGRVALKGMF